MTPPFRLNLGHRNRPTAGADAASSHLASMRSATGGPVPQVLSPAMVLACVYYWWKIAIPAGLVLAAVGVGFVWWSFEPRYEAVAWLEIKDRAQFIAFENRDNSARFISNQIELLHSPLVLGKVLEDPSIAQLPEIAATKDPMTWLSSALKVRAVGQSEYFVVSLVGKSGKDAAKIVNATIVAYDALRNEKESDRSARVIELLREESVRQKQELERLRASVRQLHLAAGGTSAEGAPSSQRRPLLTEFQAQLAAAEMERRVLEARQSALSERRGQIKVDITDSEAEKAISQVAEIAALREGIPAKKAMRLDYENRLIQPGGNPIYRQLVADLEKDQERLKALTESVRDELRRKAVAAAVDKLDEESYALTTQVRTQQVLEEMLKQRCRKEIEEVSIDRGEGLQLEFARAELARAEEVFTRIANRVIALQTEQRAPDRVSILKEASPPMQPIESIPLRQMLLVGLAGSLLPFGLAVGREALICRITSAEQIERAGQLQVIGEVPQLPVRTRGVLGLPSRRLEQQTRLFEESVDSLRTCLVLSESLRNARVVTVTSSVKGEGKTSIAVQLAVSLARASGQATLLVDGDLRDPDVHLLLDLENRPGLAEVLSRKATPEQAINTKWSRLVHIMPAGKASVSPHRLFGSGDFSLLLGVLKKRYRYVVIDTPPVLAAGEALILAENADVTLLCAMKDTSRMSQLQMTHSRLLGVNALPAGVVLNGVTARGYASRYGSYGYGENGQKHNGSLASDR